MARDAFSSFNSGGFKQFHLSKEVYNYESSVKKLNTLQTNAAVLELARQQGKVSHVELASRVDSTVKYLKRTGLTVENVDKLSIIHVSGTKGKGTTCALCESILRHHGYRTGFFSSPHLIHARERIRINGTPLGCAQFSEYFEEVYDKLESQKTHDDDMPPYFKFMTVLAFNVFIKERVDVAIIEVGIGGEYDCTNFIRKPAVVGITSLGLDHTAILGNNISEIAWQKAGIMKPGTTAFTVRPKYAAALQVMKERARARNCKLYVVPCLKSYLWDSVIDFVRDGDNVQALNSSLALQLANEWMKLQSPFLERREEKTIQEPSLAVPTAKAFQVTKKMVEGMKNCSWPGRTQILVRDRVTFFLDGAHTEESIKCCSRWFEKSSTTLGNKHEDVTKILIFNTTGQRDANKFLEILSSHNFDYAIFTTNIKKTELGTTSDSNNYTVSPDEVLKTAENNLKLWSNWAPSDATRFTVTPTVTEALARVSSLSEEGNGDYHVLITGSLHLVGNTLSILDPELLESVCHLPTDLKPLQNIYKGVQASL
ncbi:hypothetical protein RUM44_013048 [Polyplax serrata]|uniref:Folylpolyglutamate synthase n=1 Tax=Polyplax serrata TaxID=468196 RepID=A0ABR1BGR9_POLSC